MRRPLPERLPREVVERELRHELHASRWVTTADLLAALGIGPNERSLLAITLRHEVRSRPGEQLTIERGRKTMRVAGTATTIARGRASYRGSTILLSALVDAVHAVARGADAHRVVAHVDAHRVVALVLILFGLDDARVLRGERASPPPIGGERVRWLALRIRDLTRPTRAKGRSRKRSSRATQENRRAIE